MDQNEAGIFATTILGWAVQVCGLLWRLGGELSSSVQTGTPLWALWPYVALYSTAQPVQLPQGLLMNLLMERDPMVVQGYVIESWGMGERRR